ncbi:MAG: hypothetical protein A2W90_02290 [Bacteroidetes bacterium GWF2_42_66]|nr:MAG: hypothetical protein A2W92_17080 [Bacteroidetes bacterium GWA2_42_15]OFY01180.1 MAG: hypothetical protein A2W89_15775 [Bacteroidetes bacterium GWE2_42_39]OFY42023.1 MAG: hypothetical protein A2W90_02290 [Bacteroidetes bacterium GWF2_42_66]HBL77776.1 hypothetical protein [Prolixibacteraceae bacterium]HCU63257.1 hypothetical protein [Prolixibacteraceae bacterium]
MRYTSGYALAELYWPFRPEKYTCRELYIKSSFEGVGSLLLIRFTKSRKNLSFTRARRHFVRKTGGFIKNTFLKGYFLVNRGINKQIIV